MDFSGIGKSLEEAEKPIEVNEVVLTESQPVEEKKDESAVEEPADLKELAKKVELAPNKDITGESPRAQVLKEYGGIESNIPINHAYWQMKG